LYFASSTPTAATKSVQYPTSRTATRCVSPMRRCSTYPIQECETWRELRFVRQRICVSSLWRVDMPIAQERTGTHKVSPDLRIAAL
jgi:hypothetical protein